MSGGKTVAELAHIAKGRLIRGDGSVRVLRVAPTDAATPDAITFLTNPKYLPYLKTTEAAALLIAPQALDGTELPKHLAVIATPSPYAAFARVAQALVDRVPQPEGVHGSAVIDASASIGEGASIGPFVFVGPNVSIGEGAVLHAGVHVEAGASIGPGTILYNHTVIRHGCRVGAQCILHPGVVVGSDGFGFAQDEGEHVKIPQVGDVVIEDEVEIGANCCIDRGALGTTRIGAGSKIDNLVQVGHNVQIGERCIVVAQAGIAGSSKLGKSVILAAQAGVSGHVEIGDGARVLGQSGVMRAVPPGQSVLGSPAVQEREHFRTLIHIGKLDSLFKRVKKLERLLDASKTEAEEE
jgi:UDP-3-O-[3-hydroxymyristoyl] glucosamine N-acyltransferase